MSAPLAQAQSQSRAVTTALDHLRASRAALGLAAGDLGDVAVTDEYVSRVNGVTHVYLRQKVNGVEVYNGQLNAHITTDNRVVGVKSRFVPNASRTANAPTPSITAEAAVEAAARHLGLALTSAPSVLRAADERNQMLLSDAGVSLEAIPVQLVYFVQEDGTLRLAWDLSIEQLDAQHWWSLRVDAETGAVLDQNDWTVHDEWVAEDARPANYRPVAASPIVGARSGGASYNVWAYPVESPSHGDRSLAVSPEDPTASPLGWHDDSDNQYTTTRGNNVYAYEDRTATNAAGYSPEGGEELAFDFEVDLENQTPVDYEDAAITNLFYWNNIVHDVLVAAGFDEAAGNFQATNFTTAGLGNDYVRAEAQDGSGTNNANFSTPPDGSRPRMQMFQWTGSGGFTIVAPSDIAGVYAVGTADFGEPFPVDFPATEIIVAETGDGGDYPGGQPDLDLADRACEEFFNPGEVEGKIALVERGDCAFALKAWNAQQAGAIAVIIHNNSRNGDGETGSPEDISNMTATQADLPFDLNDLVIPAAFVAQSTGQLLFDNEPAEGFVRSALNRDSDLDAGVIVHEYGHGISNRLTGGPSAAGCLTGDEQMGEGWSDYYGLMLTMNEGDEGETGRGIGTYLQYEGVDGGGIRTYRYSTDMGLNPHTYDNIQGEAIPHGVGSVWAAMLWEMTWGLIDEEGFDADLINGTAGNNIALTLVTEGMKMQPCGPGFVDGRDAILMADTLTYDGAYSDIIWRAFAKRGLGFSADQGSSASRIDGTQAFDLPPGVFPVSSESDALPNGYALSSAFPNPFADRAQFTLEVAEAQAVTVAVYDVMGRTVATLHDGVLAGGTRHTFEVDGRALASGVYLVRVAGEQFAETRRMTLLR
jgi:hypothetical protein